jgi:hypothetical protein
MMEICFPHIHKANALSEVMEEFGMRINPHWIWPELNPRPSAQEASPLPLDHKIGNFKYTVSWPLDILTKFCEYPSFGSKVISWDGKSGFDSVRLYVLIK